MGTHHVASAQDGASVLFLWSHFCSWWWLGSYTGFPQTSQHRCPPLSHSASAAHVLESRGGGTGSGEGLKGIELWLGQWPMSLEGLQTMKASQVPELREIPSAGPTASTVIPHCKSSIRSSGLSTYCVQMLLRESPLCSESWAAQSRRQTARGHPHHGDALSTQREESQFFLGNTGKLEGG